MDDQDIISGMDFVKKNSVALVPHMKALFVFDRDKPQVIPLTKEPLSKIMSAMKYVRNLKRDKLNFHLGAIQFIDEPPRRRGHRRDRRGPKFDDGPGVRRRSHEVLRNMHERYATGSIFSRDGSYASQRSSYPRVDGNVPVHFKVTTMDDQDIISGMDFVKKNSVALVPHMKALFVFDRDKPQVIPLTKEPLSKIMSAMKYVRNLKRDKLNFHLGAIQFIDEPPRRRGHRRDRRGPKFDDGPGVRRRSHEVLRNMHERYATGSIFSRDGSYASQRSSYPRVDGNVPVHFKVTTMDDQDIISGMDFVKKNSVALVPHMKALFVFDRDKPQVIPLTKEPLSKTMSAMKYVRNLKRDELNFHLGAIQFIDEPPRR
ncbi:hypothetical protein OROHE_017527 [Orobanche hederae]